MESMVEAAVETGVRRAPVEAFGEVLTPGFTFEAFLAGPPNRLALAACRAAAEGSGRVAWPVFVSGGVGLGKTHLLQAVAHQWRATGTDAAYCSAEGLRRAWRTARAAGGAPEGWRGLCEAKGLLLDDLHRLRDEPDLQDEIAAWVDERLARGRWTVLASAALPRGLDDLGERLRSRCQWGWMVALEPYGPAFRRKAWAARARTLGIALDEEALTRLDAARPANLREMDGALRRWEGLRSLGGAPEEEDRDAAETAAAGAGMVTLSDVEAYVLKCYRLTREELHSPRRNRAIALPRQVAMYLMHTHTPASMELIGVHFGGKDHSTVKHACEKIRAQIKNDRCLQQLVDAFRGE